MTTLNLTNATLNINNVNLQQNGPLSGPTPTSSSKLLSVNGEVKIGDKSVSGYGNSFPLSAAELSSTSLDQIEALAVTKVKADLGIA